MLYGYGHDFRHGVCACELSYFIDSGYARIADMRKWNQSRKKRRCLWWKILHKDDL